MVPSLQTMESTRSFVKSKLEQLPNMKETKARNIETAMFNYAVKKCKSEHIKPKWENIKFRRRYLDKYRSLLSNIKRNNNLLNMKATDLVFSKHEYLAPEVWDETIKKVNLKRDGMCILLDSGDDDHVGLYTCKKCKSSNTSFFQMQTRGADEPMTSFITCKACGSTWKD